MSKGDGVVIWAKSADYADPLGYGEHQVSDIQEFFVVNYAKQSRLIIVQCSAFSGLRQDE
jgi:hypothetical protein